MLRRRAGRERGSDDGFTLVELLVVIAILGILAAIVVFAVGGLGDKGQTAADETSCSTLHTAEEAYFAQNNAYAVDPGGQDTLKAAGFLHTTNDDFTIVADGASYRVSGPHCTE